MPALFYQKL